MWQYPLNLCFVHLPGCFLKPLVSTTSWGKVLQSLKTHCVNNRRLSLVFHRPPSLITLCLQLLPGGDSAPIVPSLLSPVTNICDLWTSVISPLRHFISSLFCLVIPGWEAVPHLWSSLWPFPEPSPVQIYPFWGWRRKLHRAFKVQAHEKYTQCCNNNNLVCFFSLKAPLFDFPYWWHPDTKPVFMWKYPHRGLYSRGVIGLEAIILDWTSLAEQY